VSGIFGICGYPSFGEVSDDWVVVGIDVIRATTTAVTAVAAGRMCFPVPSLEAAVPLAGQLTNPLLAGELGGHKPFGFELQNSPAELDRSAAVDRPVILLSTSGTAMLCQAAVRHRTYVACLRNTTAQAEHLVAHHDRVMLVAGESRGEFREEDRLCCGRIARRLMAAGFQPRDVFSDEMVQTWGDADENSFLNGPSVRYLKATGQEHDLRFILEHVDDLDAVFELRDGQIVANGAP
jgi:2-phosphosulfolactate phosphatase